MARLVFYRQKRYDGATRTGVELDGQTVSERYEGGSGERDPALLWYVDLRCEGPGIPDEPDDAGRWLVGQSEIIRDGFSRYSERLRAGADPDIFSLTWSDFGTVPEGVGMTIACSAIRRVDARQMASNLTDIGTNWEAIIRSLDIPQEVEDLR